MKKAPALEGSGLVPALRGLQPQDRNTPLWFGLQILQEPVFCPIFIEQSL